MNNENIPSGRGGSEMQTDRKRSTPPGGGADWQVPTGVAEGDPVKRRSGRRWSRPAIRSVGSRDCRADIRARGGCADVDTYHS